MFSVSVKHLTSTGKFLASRSMGSSTGRIKPVIKHYDIATSYTINEENGNPPTTVNVNFPSDKYTALNYTPVWEHHRFEGWFTTDETASGSFMIPTGYTLLEYVESTGAQVIDLSQFAVGNNMCVKCKFSWISVPDSRNGVVFGTGQGIFQKIKCFGVFTQQNNGNIFYIDSNRTLSALCGSITTFPVGPNVAAGFHTVVLGLQQGFIVDGLKYSDFSGNTANPADIPVAARKMKIFAYFNSNDSSTAPNYGVTYGRCRIAEWFGVDENKKTYWLVPMKNSNGVAGLYDIVSNVFYTSNTSTALVPGPEVGYSSGVQISPLDSIVFEQDANGRWQLPTPITFDATTNGGQMPSGWITPDYYEGQPYGTLPEPTKSGEVFIGWFDSDGMLITDSSIVHSSNTTLTARYATVTWGTTYSCTTTSTYKNTGIYSANRYSSSDPIVVDWGDGTNDVVYGNISQLTHTYSDASTYTVKISDNISTFCPSYSNSTWYQTTSQNRYTFKKVLTLSSKVTQLSMYAFYYCSAMTDAIIPSNATSIPTSCFYYCSQLKSSSVQLPSTVTSIGSYAFYYCRGSSFTSIMIPASVTSIGSYAFANDNYLRNITFETSSSTLTLNTYAFSACFYSGSTAASIDLSPRKITSIPNYCFNNCRYLKGIVWPQGLTSIGGSAFRYCFYYAASTGTVEIPEGVTNISGTYAFANCLYLTAVTLPITLTNLNNYTFYYCTRLVTITCNRSTAPTVSAATFGNSATYYTGRTSYSAGTNKLYVPARATGYNASYWSSVLLDSTKCGFTLEEIAAGKTLPVTIVGSGYGGNTSYSMTIDDVGGTLTITNISGDYSFASASAWRIMDFRATSTTESFVIMETATDSNIVVGLKAYGCSEDFVGYNGAIIDSADFEP